MTPEGFVLAYHGCDIQVGERILAGKSHVRSSINEYDWLGNGAYFWENSPTRALQWAQFLNNHPKIAATEMKEPFVIGAIIKAGRCLDLTEAHCLGLVGEAYKELHATTEQSGIALPTNKAGYSGDEDLVKRFLDCTVIEFLHILQIVKHRPPFDTVRGAFFEGGELYPGARISAKTHIQWCVRDPIKSIVGYFRVTPVAKE
jgi:hypothetical protein